MGDTPGSPPLHWLALTHFLLSTVMGLSVNCKVNSFGTLCVFPPPPPPPPPLFSLTCMVEINQASIKKTHVHNYPLPSCKMKYFVPQWISPHAAQITEVAVLNGTSNDTQCGTQDLNLAFCLPVRIPVDSLQLKVNFTEVLDPGGSPRRGRFMVRTYPAQTIYNATQVRFPIPENVSQAVEGYPRFRLQAKLIVNGTEGQIWSEFSPTIQTHCKLYIVCMCSKPNSIANTLRVITRGVHRTHTPR